MSQVPASAQTAPAQESEAALAAVPAVAASACPQCGKAGARFCTTCGTSMPVAQSAEPVHGSDGPAVAMPTVADDEVDLQLSFDDTRPPEIDRAGLLESLPLHPVQRGMPDFELPEPRPQATKPFQAAATQSSAEPVTFDDFEGPDDGAAVGHGGAGGGAGLKWAALALVVLLVAGGGWWGYRHFANPEGQPAAETEAAQPAVDDVAEGESVVPSEAAADAASVPFDSGEAAAAASDPSPSVPLDAVAAGTDATSSTVGSAQADAQAAEPAADAVAPVHVLQDPPGTQAPAAPRKRSGKQSLDSLLD